MGSSPRKVCSEINSKLTGRWNSLSRRDRDTSPRTSDKEMKAIGTALLNLAAFVGLSGDEEIDPDSAVKALEQLMADLRASETGEREYIRGLIRQQIVNLPMEERTEADQERIDFFLNMMEAVDKAE